MLVTKTIRIDMGHRVTNHESKCRNLHGHSYEIECGVDDKLVTEQGSSSEGMVIDFGQLKEIMMFQLDKGFDHGFALWKNDPLLHYFEHYRDGLGMKVIITDFIPTAENLAKHWYELLKKELDVVGIAIKYVKVWETPTSTATYEE